MINVFCIINFKILVGQQFISCHLEFYKIAEISVSQILKLTEKMWFKKKKLELNMYIFHHKFKLYIESKKSSNIVEDIFKMTIKLKRNI